MLIYLGTIVQNVISMEAGIQRYLGKNLFYYWIPASVRMTMRSGNNGSIIYHYIIVQLFGK